MLNPKFVRGKAPGEAARAAAPLRNQRLVLQGEGKAGDQSSLASMRAERSRRRVEQGEITPA